jgi:hypothetical protein
VDEGNDPAYHVLADGEYTDVYVSVRDPRVTLTYLNGIQGRGYHPGLYACGQGTGWPNPTTHSGPAFADWVYDAVQKRIAPGTMGSFPKVMLNCETHDTGWLMSMFKRWRKKSPRRETYWSPEGRQAGLFSRDQVAVLNELNIRVVPQAYRGHDKTPYDAHLPGVVDEWLKAGLRSELVWLMYDGAWALPYNWQGFVFTQGRLL